MKRCNLDIIEYVKMLQLSENLIDNRVIQEMNNKLINKLIAKAEDFKELEKRITKNYADGLNTVEDIDDITNLVSSFKASKNDIKAMLGKAESSVIEIPLNYRIARDVINKINSNHVFLPDKIGYWLDNIFKEVVGRELSIEVTDGLFDLNNEYYVELEDELLFS